MNWTDEYREIVEFYYWEPQHIGRAGGKKIYSGADEMYEHINKLEVSLNHILNIFFSLFPIERLDCFEIGEPVQMLSAAILEHHQREQKNATQPDMFFVGRSRNAAIELKLAAKSNLKQIEKYMGFNDAISENTKPLTLIYLTPTNDTSHIFTEKYASKLDILSELDDKGYSEKPLLSFITYNDLYNSLRKLIPSNETEKRLITGVITYLSSRNDLGVQHYQDMQV